MKKGISQAKKKSAITSCTADVAMPLIPKQFLDDLPIAKILASTINEYEMEEQAAIYLYCTIDLPIKDIAIMTALDELPVRDTLLRFSKNLSFKLETFKKIKKIKRASQRDKVSIRELFQVDYENLAAL